MAPIISALFDLDGVVVDTESQYSVFWEEQGKKYHPEIPDLNRRIKGNTLHQIFDRFFTGQTDIQKQIAFELNDFEQQMTYEFIPGVIEFIGNLKSNQVKIAIVTSSDDLKMTHLYKAHPHIKELFDAVVTANQITKSKPDPECYLLAARLLGSAPENSYVFEDSFAGLEAGKAAHMTVIGLATTNTADQIKDKSDIVISDFTNFDFKKMIKH